MASRNLTLGRGSLYFAEFLSGTQTPGGERWIGNVTELSATSETEELEHFSSTEGRRVKDYSVVIENTRNLSITTDDMSDDNVALWALGVVEKVTIASGTAIKSEFAGVKQGYVYQLGVTNARPEGLRRVSSVVVTDDAGTPVTFAVGDDYTVDAINGRITIVAGGDIGDGTNLVVTFNNAAYSFNRITAGEDKKEGQLRWISNNPDGPERNYLFPWVKIGPNADLNMVSQDDWATLGLEGEVLVKSGSAPWIAYGDSTVTP